MIAERSGDDERRVVQQHRFLVATIRVHFDAGECTGDAKIRGAPGAIQPDAARCLEVAENLVAEASGSFKLPGLGA